MLAVAMTVGLGAARAAEVTLQMKGGDFSVKGEIKSFDGNKYVIESKSFGSMTLDANRFECVNGDCPKAGTAPVAGVAPGTSLGVATWMGGSAQGTQVMPKLIQELNAVGELDVLGQSSLDLKICSGVRRAAPT